MLQSVTSHNEYCVHTYKFHFTFVSGMWTSPSFSGPRPPPCADFSLTSVDLYRAVLYGGRRGSDEDSNDFYLIDFGKKVLISILFYTYTMIVLNDRQ